MTKSESSSSDTPVAEGYAAALAELEEILDELETDDLDVDLLARRVARAAELVRFCRSRIDDAKVEVVTIVADLDSESNPES